jgi:hypothetical protein
MLLPYAAVAVCVVLAARSVELMPQMDAASLAQVRLGQHFFEVALFVGWPYFRDFWRGIQNAQQQL